MADSMTLADEIDNYLRSVVSITPGARRLLERAGPELRKIALPEAGEATALLRLWLERLDYSDPYNDKPRVKAYLDSLQPQKEQP